MKCFRVKKDGMTFRDRWYDTQEVDFTLDKKHDILTTRSYVYYNSHYDGGTFYLDPDIPCRLVINKLMEEKRRINKTIIECQHLMYQYNNMEKDLDALSRKVAIALMDKNYTMATAEECTCGLLGACIASQVYAQRWYKGSIVAYTE